MLARSSAQLRPVITSTNRLDLARFMSSSSTGGADQLVLVDRQGPVTVLTLNRPKALNALSSPLFVQLNSELDKAAQDDQVKCIVLTGGEKVFAGKSSSHPIYSVLDRASAHLSPDSSLTLRPDSSRRGYQGDEGQELCRGLPIQLFGLVGQGHLVQETHRRRRQRLRRKFSPSCYPIPTPAFVLNLTRHVLSRNCSSEVVVSWP